MIPHQSSRRERGCYNCGNKNHLADNCPKPNNKAFVGVTWSDSEAGDEPRNDATCLMAIDSQKVRRGHDSLKDHRITDNSCTNHNNVHRRPLYSYPLNQDIDIIPISKVINLGNILPTSKNEFCLTSMVDTQPKRIMVENLIMKFNLEYFVTNTVSLTTSRHLALLNLMGLLKGRTKLCKNESYNAK
ncbi:putative reverse transcriptase domain-containing protein [Tanacetum coccineum]